MVDEAYQNQLRAGVSAFHDWLLSKINGMNERIGQLHEAYNEMTQTDESAEAIDLYDMCEITAEINHIYHQRAALQKALEVFERDFGDRLGLGDQKGNQAIADALLTLHMCFYHYRTGKITLSNQELADIRAKLHGLVQDFDEGAA